MINFLDPILPDRFWSKAIPEPNGGCWLWVASATQQGYGHMRQRATRKFKLAHVLAYEATVGCVPDGLELDHPCLSG